MSKQKYNRELRKKFNAVNRNLILFYLVNSTILLKCWKKLNPFNFSLHDIEKSLPTRQDRVRGFCGTRVNYW